MKKNVFNRFLSGLLVAMMVFVGLSFPDVHAEETVSTVYSLNAADFTTFAAGDKADGDTDIAGTENYFTVIYSVKSKIDGSNKTFDDGYASDTRFNLGGKATTSKNSIKFTTTQKNAQVKVWWVEGGDDNRQMAILDNAGVVVTKTDVTLAKGDACVSTLTLADAGTYYLGGETNNNYIFKVEVKETVTYAMVSHEYVLDATTDLTAFAAGAKADGDEEKAGTEQYFTAVYSVKSKVDGSNKTFDDGYSGTQRINFGGKAATGKNVLKFTTTTTNAQVKVWWVEGGDDNRQMAILDNAGAVATKTDVTLAKGDACVSTLTLADAGTYYLGGETNNNYIFKVVVTEKKAEQSDGPVEEPQRPGFDTVAAPTITDISAEGTKVNVKVKALVGFDGADGFVVTMTDENNAEKTAKSTKECEENTVSFTLSKSGKYSFSAHIFRTEEEPVVKSETREFTFTLPLTAPVVKTINNAGNGSVALSWNEVSEATGYVVEVEGSEIKVTTDKTEVTVEGLTAGETATLTITALRNEEKSEKTPVQIAVEAEAERVWGTARYGEGINTEKNGVIGSVKDGQVTVYSEGGKGKIQPGKTDGLTFHYTIIDPEKENFTLRAKVHVDKWTLSNGQEGFGLMVCDTVGPDGNSSTFWNNSIQAIASKIEYYYDGEKATNDTTAAKISMKLGLGTISKFGVTPADLAAIKAGTIAMPENYKAESSTLDTSAAVYGAGTYNLVGNYNGTVPTGTVENPVTDFVLEIQRNNTGYILRYLNDDGTVISEKMFYDVERNALTQLETDKIYVGFFASRNARITVSDIVLTTINPSEDAAVEERETEYIVPVSTVESAAVANSEDYVLTYYSNFNGKLTITGQNGTIADAVTVTAGKKLSFNVKLSGGNNEFRYEATPDADYVPGEYKLLSSYETISGTHVVNYSGFSGKYIYVTPTGSADAKGTKADPVDVYTAVKYAKAGQTIVLAGGKYDLSSTIKVDRGINGTKDNKIYMIADPLAAERPVFDFGGRCAGAVFAGDYWYFKGFDVTGSEDAQKGIQVSGSHNVLDSINTYKNGNTGLQISRYRSTDEFAEWPSDNLILNCTSYLNADKGYEDADGFAAKLTVGEGNVFDGCISAYNADDGWDLYAKVQTGNIGAVTIRNCVTFRNGYVLKNEAGELDINGTNLVNAGNGNGFKMGGDSLSGHHKLINSVAFENKAKGFDSNSCPDIEVYNSTAFNNESYNVAFYTNDAVNTAFKAEGIISFKNGNKTAENLKFKGTQDVAAVKNTLNYFFDGSKSVNTEGTEVSEEWFVSLDTSVAFEILNNRNADGTINMHGLLELKEDAGVNAGAVIEGKGMASSNITVTEESTPAVTPVVNPSSGNNGEVKEDAKEETKEESTVISEKKPESKPVTKPSEEPKEEETENLDTQLPAEEEIPAVNETGAEKKEEEVKEEGVKEEPEADRNEEVSAPEPSNEVPEETVAQDITFVKEGRTPLGFLQTKTSRIEAIAGVVAALGIIGGCCFIFLKKKIK